MPWPVSWNPFNLPVAPEVDPEVVRQHDERVRWIQDAERANDPAWKRWLTDIGDAGLGAVEGLLGASDETYSGKGPLTPRSTGNILGETLPSAGDIAKLAGLPFIAYKGKLPIKAIAHGTPRMRDFDKFDPSKNDIHDVLGWLTHGAEDPEYAAGYALRRHKHSAGKAENPGAGIIPLELDAKNVLDLVNPNADDLAAAISAKTDRAEKKTMLGAFKAGVKYKNMIKEGKIGPHEAAQILNIDTRHFDPGDADFIENLPSIHTSEQMRLTPTEFASTPFDAIRYTDTKHKSWAWPDTTPVRSIFGHDYTPPFRPSQDWIKPDFNVHMSGEITPNKMFPTKHQYETPGLLDKLPDDYGLMYNLNNPGQKELALLDYKYKMGGISKDEYATGLQALKDKGIDLMPHGPASKTKFDFASDADWMQSKFAANEAVKEEKEMLDQMFGKPYSVEDISKQYGSSKNHLTGKVTQIPPNWMGLPELKTDPGKASIFVATTLDYLQGIKDGSIKTAFPEWVANNTSSWDFDQIMSIIDDNMDIINKFDPTPAHLKTSPEPVMPAAGDFKPNFSGGADVASAKSWLVVDPNTEHVNIQDSAIEMYKQYLAGNLENVSDIQDKISDFYGKGIINLNTHQALNEAVQKLQKYHKANPQMTLGNLPSKQVPYGGAEQMVNFKGKQIGQEDYDLLAVMDPIGGKIDNHQAALNLWSKIEAPFGITLKDAFTKILTLNKAGVLDDYDFNHIYAKLMEFDNKKVQGQMMQEAMLPPEPVPPHLDFSEAAYPSAPKVDYITKNWDGTIDINASAEKLFNAYKNGDFTDTQAVSNALFDDKSIYPGDANQIYNKFADLKNSMLKTSGHQYAGLPLASPSEIPDNVKTMLSMDPSTGAVDTGLAAQNFYYHHNIGTFENASDVYQNLMVMEQNGAINQAQFDEIYSKFEEKLKSADPDFSKMTPEQKGIYNMGISDDPEFEAPNPDLVALNAFVDDNPVVKYKGVDIHQKHLDQLAIDPTTGEVNTQKAAQNLFSTFLNGGGGNFNQIYDELDQLYSNKVITYQDYSKIANELNTIKTTFHKNMAASGGPKATIKAPEPTKFVESKPGKIPATEQITKDANYYLGAIQGGFLKDKYEVAGAINDMINDKFYDANTGAAIYQEFLKMLGEK